MAKYIQTTSRSYVNMDKIVEIRVREYQEGHNDHGHVARFEIEAWLTELGWTAIQTGFKTKEKAEEMLIKLVINMEN